MAHIALNNDMPGIVGLLQHFPETAKPLTELAQLILIARASASFTVTERELVASYVSKMNQCVFCSESHGAAANSHAKENAFAQKAWETQAHLPLKMQRALAVAKKVQSLEFKSVSPAEVAELKTLGMTDADVHDLVLIAAAFCLYNRYVDGLGTQHPPAGHEAYKMMGEELATRGYLMN